MKIAFEDLLPKNWPESLPVNQDRAEVRISSILITGSFVYSLTKPVFYMATLDASLINRVAALTHHPDCVLWIFVLCASLAMPHLLSLCFLPEKLAKRLPRKMACAGAVIAGIEWLYLAFLASPLDVGLLPLFYGLNAFGCLVIAGLYAFSLNSQQLRALLHHESIQTA